MKLVDVHCHLEDDCFDKRLPEVIKQAEEAGVAAFITASVEPSQWTKSLSIAKKYPSVKCALGIHPWFANTKLKEALPSLADYCQHGASAVGEIGLDAKKGVPLAEQIPFFEEQLSIARELNLPVVIHCFTAFGELLKSIRRVGLPAAGGIIHSFSGSKEAAEGFISAGLSVSLGGVLTYRNSPKRARLLHYVFPDYFLLETDSPAMAPAEAKEKLNVPANIIYNLKAASEILGKSENELANTATANASRIFGLKL